MRYRLMGAVAALLAVTGALLAPQAAVAAPPRSTVGIDVSWPQCSTALPTGQAFAIVGVNGGLANNSNPCFLSQLKWAQRSTGNAAQPRVALYVNTANPGLLASWWPTSNATKQGTSVYNPYGSCEHREGPACAFVYGYTMAQDDATLRRVGDPLAYRWWLDVETINTWSSVDLEANRASLEGMVAYFHGIGAKVGLYSTSYQWGRIVGVVPSSSALNGLPSWLAGASSEPDARARCASAPLTNGGTVTMRPFVHNTLDDNVSRR